MRSPRVLANVEYPWLFPQEKSLVWTSHGKFAGNSREMQNHGEQDKTVPDCLVKRKALEEIEDDAGRIDCATRHQQPEIGSGDDGGKWFDNGENQPAQAEIQRKAGHFEAPRKQQFQHDSDGGAEPDQGK